LYNVEYLSNRTEIFVVLINFGSYPILFYLLASSTTYNCTVKLIRKCGKGSAQRLLAAKRKIRKHRAGRTAPLTRKQIVKTALALVDRHGLKALSMRRLGAELGMDPMAVYYHIPNKEALLDAIVEAVMASIDLSVYRPEDSHEEQVMSASKAYRDAMLAHMNALPIVLSRGPATAAALRPVELLTGILREAGLGPAEALAGMNTIAAAVRGFVGMIANGPTKEQLSGEMEELAEQISAGEFPCLREAMPFMKQFADHGFEFGIRSLARGLIAEAPRG
jgi:AcrR family transcriptional regulator